MNDHKTTVNISLHCYPHNNYLMTDLIKYCSTKSGSYGRVTEYITENHIAGQEKVFKIEFENENDISCFLDYLTSHKNDPIFGYNEIEAYDFTISLESSNINPLTEMLRTKSETSNQTQIGILDMITSDLASEQETIKERMDGLEAFFSKSGLIYYQQFAESLIKMLDERGIVDEKSLKENMFKQVH